MPKLWCLCSSDSRSEGIELCNPPPTSDYFSSNSIADFLTETETMSDDDESKARRERTIIDVTAQDE